MCERDDTRTTKTENTVLPAFKKQTNKQKKNSIYSIQWLHWCKKGILKHILNVYVEQVDGKTSSSKFFHSALNLSLSYL